MYLEFNMNSSNKISLSQKEQHLINVERLLACIGMIDEKSKHISLEWYPEELRDAISKFMHRDTHEVVKQLVEWIEANVDEKY